MLLNFLFLTIIIFVDLSTGQEQKGKRANVHAVQNQLNSIFPEEQKIVTLGPPRDGVQRALIDEVFSNNVVSVDDGTSNVEIAAYDDNFVDPQAEEPLFIPRPYRNETLKKKTKPPPVASRPQTPAQRPVTRRPAQIFATRPAFITTIQPNTFRQPTRLPSLPQQPQVPQRPLPQQPQVPQRPLPRKPQAPQRPLPQQPQLPQRPSPQGTQFTQQRPLPQQPQHPRQPQFPQQAPLPQQPQSQSQTKRPPPPLSQPLPSLSQPQDRPQPQLPIRPHPQPPHSPPRFTASPSQSAIDRLRTGVCDASIVYISSPLMVVAPRGAFSHFAITVSADQCARTCHEFNCALAHYNPADGRCQFNPSSAFSLPQGQCPRWPNPYYRNNVVTNAHLSIFCVQCHRPLRRGQRTRLNRNRNRFRTHILRTQFTGRLPSQFSQFPQVHGTRNLELNSDIINGKNLHLLHRGTSAKKNRFVATPRNITDLKSQLNSSNTANLSEATGLFGSLEEMRPKKRRIAIQSLTKGANEFH